MSTLEHVQQLMTQAVQCHIISILSQLTSEAEIARIHLDQAIFVESKSMLILLLPAQHCSPPPHIVRAERLLKQHAGCQTSDESQLKPALMTFFQMGWKCLKAE